MLYHILPFVFATTSEPPVCTSIRDTYTPCCGPSPTAPDVSELCATYDIPISMRESIRGKFTAAQLASWDMTGQTITTSYSPWTGDIQTTPFGLSGRNIHHYAVIEILTGAKVEARTTGNCGPHYNLYTDGFKCQIHHSWYDSASRVAATEGKAIFVNLAVDDYDQSIIYVHKSTLDEARSALFAALGQRSPTEITFGINGAKTMADPYFATQALMDAGWKYVHTAGSACTDNIGDANHGNVSFTTENSIILPDYSQSYFDVIDAQIADKKGFTIKASITPEEAVHWTPIELVVDDQTGTTVGCKPYYDGMWIHYEHMDAPTFHKLASMAQAAAAAKIYQTGLRFAKAHTPCTTGNNGMELKSTYKVRLDTTPYCDTSIDIDSHAHSSGTTLVY